MRRRRGPTAKGYLILGVLVILAGVVLALRGRPPRQPTPAKPPPSRSAALQGPASPFHHSEPAREVAGDDQPVAEYAVEPADMKEDAPPAPGSAQSGDAPLDKSAARRRARRAASRRARRAALARRRRRRRAAGSGLRRGSAAARGSDGYRPVMASFEAPEQPVADRAHEPQPQGPTLPELPTRQQVASVMSRASSAVQRCYDAAMVPGEVTVVLQVRGDSGRVASVEASAGQQTGSCVTRTLKKLRFPRFARRETTIRYPYRFR